MKTELEMVFSPIEEGGTSENPWGMYLVKYEKRKHTFWDSVAENLEVIPDRKKGIWETIRCNPIRQREYVKTAWWIGRKLDEFYTKIKDVHNEVDITRDKMVRILSVGDRLGEKFMIEADMLENVRVP